MCLRKFFAFKCILWTHTPCFSCVRGVDFVKGPSIEMHVSAGFGIGLGRWVRASRESQVYEWRAVRSREVSV